MRSFSKIRMAAVLGTALTVAGMNAETINQRREIQQDRIAQGVKSGSLTAGETARLETKEARLNREIRDGPEDHNGQLTKAERAQVNRQQNRLSRQIYRAKHKG
jgi:hypothetical protein